MNTKMISRTQLFDEKVNVDELNKYGYWYFNKVNFIYLIKLNAEDLSIQPCGHYLGRQHPKEISNTGRE